MMPIDFANPQYLAFFALFIPLVGAWVAYVVWYRRTRRRAGDAALVDAMTADLDCRGRTIQRLMQLTAIALLIVAAARPQWGDVDEEIQEEALDVVFAIDLSRSMLAEDIAPDRLTAAHKEVQRTVEGLHSDRVGLVIFTSISFVQSPLTTDHTTINFFLDRLHPEQIPVSGTNIGAAIDDSISVLTGHGDDDARIQRSEEQVIVLMTDGEDHESEPLQSARDAADEGIRIVGVGIGDPDGAHIPIYDDDGRKTDYVRHDDGEKVLTKADQQMLRDMADITGGKHIIFEKQGQASTKIIEFLDDLERSVVEERIVDYRVDRFMWFLVPAAMLLLLSLLFGGRRSTRRKWLPFALVIILGLTTGCDTTFQRLHPEVSEAIDAIEEGDYEEALQILDALSDEDLDRPETYFNRGRAHLGLEEYDEARSAFATALSSDDPDLRADAHYHIGLTEAAKQEWAGAVDEFQHGLQLFTASGGATDSELRDLLRENLEVALRELYPPCSTMEDEFAPNHSPDSAAAIEEWPLTDLTLCGDSDDYFTTSAFVGGELSVEASFGELRDEPDPEHVFLPDAQDLELVVYTPDGQTLLAQDRAQDTSDETLGAENQRRQTTRKVKDIALDGELFQADPGDMSTVLIGLRAAEELEFSYELDVDHSPPCEALDDDFEPNSTVDDAADLPAEMGHQLHLCAGDEDWFRLRANAADSLFVDIRSATDELHPEPANLDVELFRADTGESLGKGQPDGAYITAGVDELDYDTDLLLRVRGADSDQEGPYVADVHHFEPCPQGTDRYHPNHEVMLSTRLSEDEPEHRYLRLCEEDLDHFLATHESQADGVDWTIDIVPEDAWRGEPDRTADEPFGSHPDMTLELLDTRGGASVHATAIGPDHEDAPALPDHALTEPRYLRTDDSPHREQAVLRVHGEPGFYHLHRPDDEDGDGEDDQQDDEQDDPEDDQDDQDDSEDDQDNSEDEQDEGDEEEQQDEEEGDGSDDEDDHTDPEDQDGPDEPETPEMSAEELHDLLRSIEEEDDNFQLRRTLEDAPRRPVEQEW